MADDVNLRKRSSMDYWFPKLESTGVPVPDTRKQTFRDWEAATEIVEGVPVRAIDFEQLVEDIRAVGGPPAFIRTDQSSAKHNMDKASRVTDTEEEALQETVFELLQHNELAGFGGLPYRSIYVREWLDLNAPFKAFSGAPVASEVRVFIHNGEIHDTGFYWPADAIAEARHTQELPDDWRDQLAALKTHALDQVEDKIRPLAETVAAEFDGYWSVDFAETETGDWYAIDMARGEASWHPESVAPPETVDAR